MGRKILAVIVALIVCTGVIMIVEMINSVQFKPPTTEIMNDPAKLAVYMANGPVGAYIVVLIGYIIGAFVGGFIVTKMSRQVSPGTTMPIIVGTLLMLLLVANIMMLPGQPVWFIVASFIVFIPFSLVGHRFAR